jgi:hypothetical protein
MFHAGKPLEPSIGCDVAAVLETLATVSSRPRYAFMLLNLIAQVAGPDGSAGPWVRRNDGLVSLRDWLCDALTPMAQRGPRSITLAERVESDLSLETDCSPAIWRKARRDRGGNAGTHSHSRQE